MGREGTTVQIEGDGGAASLSVWLDDQGEFVVMQVDNGAVISVRPQAVRDAMDFVCGEYVSWVKP